jgi:hypothetical protein
VGEAHLGDVAGQLLRQLPVGETWPPRSQMDLVDTQRRARELPLPTRIDPAGVLPLMRGGVDDRRGRRRRFGQAGHGVGLAVPLPVGGPDLVLVAGAFRHPRHEQLPDPRAAERAHRVAAAIPVVEVADDPHALRVRRPHRERGAAGRPEAAGRAVLAHVRAEHPPQLLVPALADQVQVHLAERGQVPVGVVGHDLRRRGAAVRPGIGDGQPVVGHPRARQRRREHALVHVAQREPAAVGQDRGNAGGHRHERADGDAVRPGVRPEQRVGVVVGAGDDPVDLTGADAGHLVRCASHAHTPSPCPAPAMAPSGMCSQPGRFLAS